MADTNRTQAAMDKAVSDMSAMDDVVDSAMALIDTLVATVRANKTDPAALEAALVTIEAKKEALANSVATNTDASGDVTTA